MRAGRELALDIPAICDKLGRQLGLLREPFNFAGAKNGNELSAGLGPVRNLEWVLRSQ
jgi:hypothetical protein